MKLKKQLFVGFGGVLLLVLTISILSLWEFNEMMTYNEAITMDSARLQIVGEMKANVALAQQSEIKQIFASDPQLIASLKQEIADIKVKNNELYKRLDLLFTSDEDKTRIQNLGVIRKNTVETYATMLSQVATIDHKNRMEFAENAIREATKQYNNVLDEFLDHEHKKLQATQDTIKEQTQRLKIMILSILGIVICVTVFTAIRITQSVFNILGGEPEEAAKSVELIAKGNLAYPIAHTHSESLLGHLDTMRISLNQLIAHLSKDASQLVDFSNQLAATAEQVASGATHGSEASANMATTVEQMTSSLSHIAENVAHASASVTETGNVATEGSNQILNLARSMSIIAVSVKESSEKITDLDQLSTEIRSIVDVIKGIADQTNLLALNAAIEAARAVETGRGFAVVADEVRKLAELTANSTGDIASKIEAIQGNIRDVVSTMEHSVEEVLNGEQLAGQGAQAINTIKTATDNIIEIVNNINIAIQENSQASQNAAENVEEVAQLAEDNAQAAKQVAQTATSLTKLATELNHTTHQFKTI